MRQLIGRSAVILNVLLFATLLTACSRIPAPDGSASVLNDSALVLQRLHDQLHLWRGTPYYYGGMSKRGVDCSGFVMLTFRDHFGTVLPRETWQQAKFGHRINKNELRSGDLVFFKTGSGENNLHVGIYDDNNQFIHASTRRGVIRSSLNNPYWRKHFWQARRVNH